MKTEKLPLQQAAPNFYDMYEQAKRAYSGTSFDPEQRAYEDLVGYEKGLQEDLKTLDVEFDQDYFDKYKGFVSSIFAKRSRIMSAAIVGPARFPSARMHKYEGYLYNEIDKFNAWRKKRLTPKKEKLTEDQAWTAFKKDITNSIQAIVTNWGTRSLFVNSIYNKTLTQANKGNVELVKKAINHIEVINEALKNKGKKPVITTRHKFFKLAEVAEAVAQKASEDKDGINDKELSFDGGKIIFNKAANRIQIFHDEKPDAEVRNLLKKNAFRWSPKNECWQRILTDNAVYATNQLLKQL